MTLERFQRQLIAAGAVLFVLGLATGFVIPTFVNPRMGLASHIEGVMNGTFLIAVGAATSRLGFSSKQLSVTFWLLLYGTYSNWFFIGLAAVFGTKSLTPIAGAGFQGQPWQESLIQAGLSAVGLTMFAGCALLAYGLLRKGASADAQVLNTNG